MDDAMQELDPHGNEERIWRNRALWFVLLCVWARLATLHMHHPSLGYDENFPCSPSTYRLEFTPRAVIGTIYDYLRNSFGIGWKAFCVLRFGFAVCAYTAIAIGVFRLLARLHDHRFAVLFGLFIFAMPSTFHSAAIISMFDIYIVCIMLLCTWITMKSKTALYVLVPPLCALAVLIHENFIFMYLPFLIGLLAWRGELACLRGWLKASVTAIATFGTFGAMSFYRARLHTQPGALDALNDALVQRAAEHGVELQQCLVTLEMTYWEHVKSVWSHFFLEQYGPYQIAINMISMILLIPAAVVIARLWLNAWRQTPADARRRLLVLLLSCFGACGLFIVAHDYIRWMTAIFICQTIALTIVYTDKRHPIHFELTARQALHWACICLFYLCLDPPTAICFPVADLVAYPIYKLCM